MKILLNIISYTNSMIKKRLHKLCSLIGFEKIIDFFFRLLVPESRYEFLVLVFLVR